jgi:pimeloyl-ACP methyl ester carboxylesterase
VRSVEPRFFGPAERQLFGVYHPPMGRAAHPAGVLLCYPAPQEYMRCHWAFRKLATLLARAGFHVLRFDWFACGDSAGASDQGSLHQWRLDVATALDELRDVSGLRRASLVGFRLGAALALQAGVKVRDLVLWEPVVSGRAHVAELMRQHELRFNHCLHPPPLPEELMGQPFPRALRQELDALDLLDARPAGRAERVVVLGAEERPEYAALVDALRAHDAFGSLAWRHVPEPPQPEADDAFLLSTRALQAIAALLGGDAVMA